MNRPDDGAHPCTTPIDRPRRLFSRFYAAMSERMDDEGLREPRTELLADLPGTVVEIGAGNGRNFACYPTTVTQVHAIEPEPHPCVHWPPWPRRPPPVPITVHAAVAEDLPQPDAGADAVVYCLVLCSIPNRTAALAEARRVLRPRGTLRFFEHTIATTRGLRTVQRLADATIWPLLTGGCHTATDPVADINRAGFTVDMIALRRLKFQANRFTQPSSPHVLGAATAPTTPQSEPGRRPGPSQTR